MVPGGMVASAGYVICWLKLPKLNVFVTPATIGWAGSIVLGSESPPALPPPKPEVPMLAISVLLAGALQGGLGGTAEGVTRHSFPLLPSPACAVATKRLPLTSN